MDGIERAEHVRVEQAGGVEGEDPEGRLPGAGAGRQVPDQRGHLLRRVDARRPCRGHDVRRAVPEHPVEHHAVEPVLDRSVDEAEDDLALALAEIRSLALASL